MVYILHHHVAQGQSLLFIILLSIHLHNAIAVFFQPTEASCQRGFSGPVMSNQCNDAALRQGKTLNIQGVPMLSVCKMKILTLNLSFFVKRMGR